MTESEREILPKVPTIVVIVTGCAQTEKKGERERQVKT